MENECSVDGCNQKIVNKRRHLCGRHYSYFLTGSEMTLKPKTRPINLSDDEVLRYWGWLVHEETGCWEWSGNRDRLGYGRLKLRNKSAKAYRLAYETWVKKIPEGMAILHKCDNPPCINPDHLLLGTQADNVYDMHDKGRAKGGVKFSEDYMRAAKAIYETGKLTQAEVESAFGLSKGHVSRLMSGKIWPQLQNKE